MRDSEETPMVSVSRIAITDMKVLIAEYRQPHVLFTGDLEDMKERAEDVQNNKINKLSSILNSLGELEGKQNG